MKTNKLLYVMLAGVMVTSACKKEEKLNVDLTKTDTNSFVPGETDIWLNQNFLDPYNMEVIYRFDRFQAKVDKDLAPVLESQIQPVMETVRDIWIEPYLQVAGKQFLKPLIPKQMVLVGSAEYNIDGSITLGTADAGRRINLFVLNDFSKDNIAGVEQMMHTIHHEFAHILHQNIPVPPEYKDISPEYVGGSWISFSNDAATAKNLGFITRYSRLNDNEDFVEVASTLLVEGQDRFSAYTNTASESGANRLRQKEQMLVNYYKTAYNIDFRELQAKVKKSLETLTGNIVPFRTTLNAGSYRILRVSKSAVGQSSGFVTAYDQMLANMVARGFTFQTAFDLEFNNIATARNSMTLKLTGTSSAGTYSFWYDFNVSINTSTGEVKFTLVDPQPTALAAHRNGTSFRTQAKPLLDYLTTNTFKADWVESIVPDSRSKLGGFYISSTNNIGFYASLIN